MTEFNNEGEVARLTMYFVTYCNQFSIICEKINFNIIIKESTINPIDDHQPYYCLFSIMTIGMTVGKSDIVLYCLASGMLGG